MKWHALVAGLFAVAASASAPTLFWTYQAYSASDVDKQWCAAWAAFKLAPSAERKK